MLPPFYRDTTFFLIPYYWYNDTLRKERELSLLPSSTVHNKSKVLEDNIVQFRADFFNG